MGFFQKGLMLYLFIAIAFAYAFPETVLGTTSLGKSALGTFTGLTYNSSSHDIVIGQPGIDSNISNITQPGSGMFSTGSGQTQSFFSIIIDGLSNMLQFIVIIFSIVLSPLVLITSPAMAGAPTAVYMLIGIPLVFGFICAVAVMIGGRVD